MIISVSRRPEVRARFDAILAAVEALGPVQVLAEKTRIAFQVRMSFAAFMPRRRWLDGHLVLDRPIRQHPVPHRADFLAAQRAAYLPAARSGRGRRGVPRLAGRGVPGGRAAAPGPPATVTRWVSAAPSSSRSATRRVPDLIGPGLRLLFVGINPGLWTAATQTHFAHPGNRFYPALRLAGIVDRDLDRAGGMTDEDRRYLVGRGIGITNLVNRATARADELDRRRAARRAGSGWRQFVTAHAPAVVAVAGITAYRTAFGRPKARSRRAAGGPGRRPAVGRAQPQRAERPRDAGHAWPPRTPPPPGPPG